MSSSAGRAKRDREKARQEKAALKTAYERDILQSQLEVQNQTLQQIGQELHDNVGQILSVARLHLNFLEEQQTDSETHQYAKSTNELIGKAIADIRTAKCINRLIVITHGKNSTLISGQ